MTEQELNDWGIHSDLDETEKAYRLAGISKSWQDYTYPDWAKRMERGEDDLWDQEAYYFDFDGWWVKLPYGEKLRIYNQINYGTV